MNIILQTFRNTMELVARVQSAISFSECFLHAVFLELPRLYDDLLFDHEEYVYSLSDLVLLQSKPYL